MVIYVLLPSVYVYIRQAAVLYAALIRPLDVRPRLPQMVTTLESV